MKIKQREEKEPDKNLRKEVLFNSNSVTEEVNGIEDASASKMSRQTLK